MKRTLVLENTNHFLQFHTIKARTITTLIGGVPRPLGVWMRRFLYKNIFASMGKNIYIQAGSEFLGADAIKIGDDVKIMRDVRLNVKSTNSFIHLGSKVCLDRGVDINVAGEDCFIEIGDRSYLGPYVCMSGPGVIKIGRQCLIASQAGIYANNHREYGLSREGITIEDNCWLGTGVRILDGVTIGRGSVVGAGSVVTKNIPPYSVAVGVPAKRIKASKGGCA